MSALVPYILVGWIPFVLLVFPLMRPHRALLFTFVAGLLFLPQSAHGPDVRIISLSGLHFVKLNVISYAALLGVLIYDWPYFMTFRPSWIDLPMFVWCICPMFSALTNEPPPDGSSYLKDGIAQANQQTILWGVPYLLGRHYFSDWRKLAELCFAIIIGGVVYVPLCLYEIRMSPQLHSLVYGYHQHQFAQTIRFGGYRPMVFMQHGLLLAMWMVVATLLAIILGQAKNPPGGPINDLRPLPLIVSERGFDTVVVSVVPLHHVSPIGMLRAP